MIKDKTNFILFIFLACLWSGSFIGIKAVVTIWPPIFGAAIRVAIALICLMLLIFSLRKNVAISYTLRWKIWMTGLFSQGIPFAFLFWGEQLISPGLAGILNSTISIWTYIFALIFVPHACNLSLRKLFGLLIGIVGVIIIFWPMLTFARSSATLLGAGAVLIMAMSYAIGALFNQHFLADKVCVDFFANVYHQHWGSLVFLVIISLLFEPWPSFHILSANLIAWGASLYLGIFSSAMAWIIYYHLIREWDALRASTVMYIVPVLTLLWDYLFFTTRPHAFEIWGVIAILLGIILTQLSSFKKKSSIIRRFRKFI